MRWQRNLSAHRISQVDEASIRDFLGEYTHHAHLNSDEIWLFFDMVKLALIENIAYLCKRIRFCIKEYEYAHKYAAYVLSKRADAEQMRQKVLRYFYAWAYRQDICVSVFGTGKA